METNNFSLSLLLKYLGLFLLIPKYFLFSFKRFLFENFRYSVDLANIISLALTNIFSILYILSITRSDILSLILFIASIKGYISFTSFGYYITKKTKQQSLYSGSIIGKKETFGLQAKLPI
jgi:hypothetical protein